MHNVGDDEDSCYPSIINEMEFEHESVHREDCLEVKNSRYSYNVENNIAFDWMEEVRDFAEPLKDPDNKQPQALTETEISAYRVTIAFLEGWEEDNCEPK